MKTLPKAVEERAREYASSYWYNGDRFAYDVADSEMGETKTIYLAGAREALPYIEIAKELAAALSACAPSWLPEKVRDQRREALRKFRGEA